MMGDRVPAAASPAAGREKGTGMDNSLIGGLSGQNVIIRTVTHYYTGRLSAADGTWLQLDDAAWIADTGRWSKALETGELREVEPYPGTCWVALAAVVDLARWSHDLPRATR